MSNLDFKNLTSATFFDFATFTTFYNYFFQEKDKSPNSLKAES